MLSSKLPKIIISTLVIVIILGYAVFQVRNLVKGPILLVSSPITGTTFNDPQISIRGIIENASRATLNERQIFIDEKGNFNETILLSEGYKLVEIKIEDKFEREKTELLEIVYIPKS